LGGFRQNSNQLTSSRAGDLDCQELGQGKNSIAGAEKQGDTHAYKRDGNKIEEEIPGKKPSIFMRVRKPPTWKQEYPLDPLTV